MLKEKQHFLVLSFAFSSLFNLYGKKICYAFLFIFFLLFYWFICIWATIGWWANGMWLICFRFYYKLFLFHILRAFLLVLSRIYFTCFCFRVSRFMSNWCLHKTYGLNAAAETKRFGTKFLREFWDKVSERNLGHNILYGTFWSKLDESVLSKSSSFTIHSSDRVFVV